MAKHMLVHHVGPLLLSVLLLKFENKLSVIGLYVFVENQKDISEKMFDKGCPL